MTAIELDCRACHYVGHHDIDTGTNPTGKPGLRARCPRCERTNWCEIDYSGPEGGA